LGCCLAGRVRGLRAGPASHHLPARRLAFGRSLLHAASRTARGQRPTRPTAWKTPLLQGLAALSLIGFPFRRHLEIAPRPAFRQAMQGRLIHFSPTQLWRCVDNVTARLIGQPPPRQGGVQVARQLARIALCRFPFVSPNRRSARATRRVRLRAGRAGADAGRSA
jgi:hypothetical protein